MPRMLRPRTVFILRDYRALFHATTNMEAIAITMDEGFRGRLPSDIRPMPAEKLRAARQPMHFGIAFSVH